MMRLGNVANYRSLALILVITVRAHARPPWKSGNHRVFPSIIAFWPRLRFPKRSLIFNFVSWREENKLLSFCSGHFDS